MKTVNQTLLLLAFWLIMLNFIQAQDIWQNKSFEQWTKEDIIKVASNSPWAQVVQSGPVTAERTPTAYLPAVTIRLRSALVIRRALVRLKQIDSNYNRMNDQQRADFDAKVKGVLDCPACADNYVITIGPPISTHEMNSAVGSLRNVILSQLVGRVYIANERGERRELIHFVAPKTAEDEATFFFPRLDNQAHPLVARDNKKLLFIFEAKNLRTGFGLDSIPERFEFDVTKMIIDGKVDF